MQLDVKYFLSGGFWLSLINISSALKTLLIGIFLARILGKNDFGLYTYILSIFFLANIFGAPGMSIAILQSVSMGFEGTFRFLNKKVFIWSLAGTAFLGIFGIYEKFFHQNELALVFFLLAIIFPFYSVSTNYIYYLSGKKQFRKRMWFEVFGNLVNICVTVLAVFLFENAQVSVVAFILSQTVVGLFFTFKLWTEGNDLVDEKANNYGIKLTYANIGPIIKMQLDKIILARTLGFSAVAQFNIGSAFSDQVYAFAKIIATIIMPKSAHLSHDQIKGSLKKIIWLSCLLFFFLSLVLIGLYPYIIPILFGAQYKEAILYAQIITLFVSFKSMGVILLQISQSKKDLRSTFVTSYVSPIIEVVLMLTFVFPFGIWGIIFAKVIADALNLFFTIYLFYKKNNSF